MASRGVDPGHARLPCQMGRPVRHVALRYMSRFRCIGPACEDSCCHMWKVPVDQGHYVRLRRALSRPAGGARQIQDVLVLAPPEQRTREHFALVRLRDDGCCPFLDPDRLCAIHRHLGEEMLPDVCAVYPRHIARVGTRLELTGLLSCPEVARLALLADDATDLIEVDPGLFGRGAARPDASTASTTGLARHLDEVRGTLYSLLSRTGYPLPSRLYFAAFLAERTDDLFRQQPFDQRALEAAIDEMDRPAALAALHEAFARAAPPLPRGLEVVAEALGLDSDQRLHPSLHRLLSTVLDSYAPELAARSAQGHEAGIGALAAAYAWRREQVQGAFGDALGRYLSNYCRHHCIQEWHLASGTLRSHVLGLMARVAILRFLLLSHPAAVSAAAQGDEAALGRVAVAVCHALTRGAEHNPTFAQRLGPDLERRLPDLAHTCWLLAV